MKQYLYGKQPILMRIQQNQRIEHLYIQEGAKAMLDVARQHRINYTIVSKKQLDQMSDFQNHQGVIGEIKPYATVSLDVLLQRKQEHGLIIMLDGITDPHNMGAIIRSCDGVNADGIIIKKHGSSKLTSTVAKVASGGLENIPVAVVSNLSQTLVALKKQGYWVVGTDMENASYYRDVDYVQNIVLVVGSEGKGISHLVKKHCDFMVQIPMTGVVASLNVSVATGIILYEILHQRRG